MVHEFKAAFVSIYTEQCETVNVKRLKRFFCSDCITKFYGDGDFSEYRDIAIINFSERTLTPLKKPAEDFMSGDYRVNFTNYEKPELGYPEKIKYTIYFN